MNVSYKANIKLDSALIISRHCDTFICKSEDESATHRYSSDFGLQKFCLNNTVIVPCTVNTLKGTLKSYLGEYFSKIKDFLPFVYAHKYPKEDINNYVIDIYKHLDALIKTHKLHLSLALEFINVRKIKIMKEGQIRLVETKYVVLSYFIQDTTNIIANDFIVSKYLDSDTKDNFINEINNEINWYYKDKELIEVKDKTNFVMKNKAAGIIFHEFLGHLLECDNYSYSPISLFFDQLICDPQINIFENCSVEDNYDDCACIVEKEINVVKDGRINRLLTNEIYAKLCNIDNSGNSITEFPQKEPQIRMRNMYVKKGELSFEDALSEIETGILIEKVGMGEVNMYTGDFFLMASRAYKITSGKIGTPLLIKPLHFDALKFNNYQIKLCNDSLDNMSLCGKNGSIVNVRYNCPSIILRD